MSQKRVACLGSAAGRSQATFIFLLILCVLGLPARAAEPLKGIALVIGQSSYEALPALPNPERDARAIEDLLAKLGFETDLATDASLKKLRRAIDGFIEDAEGVDVALVYYSGHGIEAGGINYLIPTDATAGSLEDADERLVPLQSVLERLRSKARITILLLDACRSSPFPKDAQVRRTAEATPQSITGQGLGAPRGALVIDTMVPTDTIGEVIGFAAEPGRVALDGAVGGNSPYATALLRHFSANAGFDFGQVMTMVTEEVYLTTGTRQRPWTNTSLRQVLAFGGQVDSASSDDALLDRERRKLLLTIAATPQEWRSTVEALARDRSLPLDPLYGILKELQVDTTLGRDKLDEQLRQGAENLTKILAERTPLRKDPELNRLADLADRAQAQGTLELARDYRAKASARADELGKKLDEREAEINADRIELAMIYADEAATARLVGRTEEAAAMYQKAYQQLQGKDDKLGFKFKLSEASIYLARRRHPIIKDVTATKKAAIAFAEAIVIAERMGDRGAWATAQTGRADALALSGRGQANLVEAISAYEAALTVWTPQHDVQEWSKAQYGRAGVLARLGESEIPEGCEKFPDDGRCHSREGTTRAADLLSEAVATYQTLLLVVMPDKEPLYWSSAQYKLGDVHMSLRALDAKGSHLTKAVAAYRAALLEKALEARAGVKASIQVRLGQALTALGDTENNLTAFNEALQVFEGAISTRETAHMPSSTILDEIGWTKLLLGRQTGSRTTIAEGRQLVEKSWAAYKAIGLSEKDAYFKERLKQFDEALRSIEP
jgi:uncharacterized caspase-like protein